MSNGNQSYDVSLSIEGDVFDRDRFRLSGLGLFPSKRGWSGLNNFLDIQVDDVPVLPCEFRIAELVSGEEGVAVLQGETEAVVVMLTFRTRAMSDCVLLSVDLDLRSSAKAVTLTMIAYPGEFAKVVAGKNAPLGPVSTRILTATGEESRSSGILDTKRQNWLFLYDSNYDPAKTPQIGGEMSACGLVFNPADMQGASFEKRAGWVSVRFVLAGGDAGTRVSTDFALWEFMTSNHDGRATMQSIVVHP